MHAYHIQNNFEMFLNYSLGHTLLKNSLEINDSNYIYLASYNLQITFMNSFSFDPYREVIITIL